MVSKRIFYSLFITILLVLLVTIGILLSVKNKAEKRLELASGFLRELGLQYIDYVVHVDQEIPLKTEVFISRTIPVNIDMNITDSVQIKANIPVRDSIIVPIQLQLNELLDMDTSIQITQQVMVMLEAEIPIDQKFTTKPFGDALALDIPIEAELKLDQPVYISFPQAMPVKSQIPVKFAIKQNMPTLIQMNVPMNQKIPLTLSLRGQRAFVSFTSSMPIEGLIPIVMDIPVKIPMKETPIKSYLDKVADQLDDMLAF
jgi:hypothetical protein